MNRAPSRSALVGLVCGVGVAAAIAVGVTLGLEPAVLTLAGGVLLLVILLLWSSLLDLTGESPLSLEEAISLAAPTAEEEQKRAVLRTLKDLEYELSVGKISDADYRELSTTYRERAKELIRAADHGLSSGRERAELLLEQRLEKDHKGSKAKKRKGSKKVGRGAKRPAIETRQGERLLCARCDAKNDADAKFCKSCGNSLGAVS